MRGLAYAGRDGAGDGAGSWGVVLRAVRPSGSALAGVAVGGLALAVTAWWGVWLTPDMSLYLGSGFGLYPSVFGTALGAAGPTVFVVAHGAAVGCLGWGIARARPSLVAVALSLPVLWWVFPLGVDPIAAALLAGAWAGAGGLAWLAIGIHYAALPVAAALWVWRSRYGLLLAGGCAALGLVLATATPYGAAFGLSVETGVRAVPAFVVVMLIASAPMLAGCVTGSGVSLVLPVWLGTAAVVGYATVAHAASGVAFSLSVFSSSRYALPLTVVLLLAQRATWAIGAASDGSGERVR